MVPRTRDKREASPLGDSWVLDGRLDESLTDAQAPSPQYRLRTTAAREARRARSPTSPEPQLLMPNINQEIPSESRQRRRRSVRKPTTSSPQTDKGPNNRQARRETTPQIGDSWAMAEEFLFDVLGRTLKKLKTPVAYGLAVYIVLGMMIMARNIVFDQVQTALSPICRIPGASIFNLPFCHHPVTATYRGSKPPPAQFDRLAEIQSKLEALMLQAANDLPIPVHMQRSQLSIRDLRAHVRRSSIASKQEVVFELDEFLKHVEQAAVNYQHFSSLVSRAVDRIVPAARLAKRTIDRTKDHAANGMGSSVGMFVSNTVLAPFQPLRFSDDVILHNYLQVLHVTQREVEQLLDRASEVLHAFAKLDDSLDRIHDVAIRDIGLAESQRDEVLYRLWTRLGGNRDLLYEFDKQLRILAHVADHQRTAMAHLSLSIMDLQGMKADLQELGERVVNGPERQAAASERDGHDVPLSLHLEALEASVARLERTNQRTRKQEWDFLGSKERRKIWQAELEPSLMVDAGVPHDH